MSFIKFLRELIKPSIIFSLLLICSIIIAYVISTFIGFDPEKLFHGLDVSAKDIERTTSFEHTVALFKNNIGVPIQILFLAIIPIPYLYTIVLLFNGVLNGLMFYIYQAVHLATGKGEPLFQMILKGYLPHAIFELLAFIIATALAFKINQWIVRKIIYVFGGKRDVHFSFKDLLLQSVFIFVIIIFPLVLVAAVIEGYITPLLL